MSTNSEHCRLLPRRPRLTKAAASAATTATTAPSSRWPAARAPRVHSDGEHGAPEPHPESMLVLYPGDGESVRAVAARLGAEPVAPANPYWAEHGLTFEDPD